MQAYLIELRNRALRCAAVFIICFTALFYYANDVYDLVSKPIIKTLPPEIKFITTTVTAPLMVPIQLAFLIAIVIITPFILWQIWHFVKPALYKTESKAIFPLILTSGFLFYFGLIFGLFIISPYALQFFLSAAPNNISVMLDIGNYLDFVVKVCLFTAIIFQIPIITKLLVKLKIVTKKQLANTRKIIIVIAFILGMLLTPPDVVSQIMVAIPMWLLFEIGLLFA